MEAVMENGTTVLFPEGRVDSSNAQQFEKEIFEEVKRHPDTAPIFDFERLLYISSAGLRVLLKAARQFPEPVRVRNASEEVWQIMEMTGFTSILDVRKKMREISVDGCEIIGWGANGTVYRIDPDTIVKVYNAPDALAMIENEQKCAKQAFLKGIPTAISYDIVKVGDRYGSVFELVKAETLNDRLIREPEKLEETIRSYADIVSQVHAITMEKGVLPDARALYLGYLDSVSDLLSGGVYSRLRELLSAMPEDFHVVHGDLHMKNVMFMDGKLILIDMDTMSTGNPVFDFAGLYVAYRAFEEDAPGNSMEFYGIPEEVCGRIWQRLLELCLCPADENELRKIEDRVRVLGYLRFIYILTIIGNGETELREIRLRKSNERLAALLERVTELTL